MGDTGPFMTAASVTRGVPPADDVVLAGIVRLSGPEAPTVRELAEDLGVPHTTLHEKLMELRDAGRVTWRTGRPRTLRLMEERCVACSGARVVGAQNPLLRRMGPCPEVRCLQCWMVWG